jgi:glucose/arabinose dehydrogenase
MQKKIGRLHLHLACLLVAFLLAPAQAQPQRVKTVTTDAGKVIVENVVGGLNHPWGMAFLPDGRVLITERNTGDLLIAKLNGSLSKPLQGTPKVFAQGQGGLLDVALHPDFQENRLVYLSYAAPGPGGSAATALGRGRLTEKGLEGFQEIFLQKPYIKGPNHFGGRIVFTPDKHLFLTMGERFQFEPAQDLSNHLGTIVRLNLDGSVPKDNPFVDKKNAKPEIWSYGHRNIEAATLNPATNSLWTAEMGPKGGDELNLPEPGRNYGWPVVSWGENYDGSDIPDPPTKPKFAESIKHWTPVISPSGMTVYTGGQFPRWKGDVFIGGLTARGLVRLQTEGDKVISEERIPLGARIRDVVQGPEGYLYVLTDQNGGNLWRLKPAE